MAIYHLSMGQVSRSTGRSAVQAAAYITATCLVEDRRGITADYRRKDADIFWETLAPEGSGIDRKDLSIWNKLESYEDVFAEKRYRNSEAKEKFKNSAQVAHTYVFALPKELTRDQNIELIREIIEERFVALGLVATYSIHWEEGNPHVHIEASHRAVEGNIEKGGTFSYFKVARQLCSRQALRETRKFFADKTNATFERLGMEERIDHRSYAERGLDLIPSQHKGWMAHQIERQGGHSRILSDNQEIFEANKEKIAQEPLIILQELTSKQATFSELDVIRLTQKRLGDDPAILAEYVIHCVMEEAVEVGMGLDQNKRYTSKAYQEKEQAVLASLQAYAQSKASVLIDAENVEALLKGDASWLSEEQQQAVRTLCSDTQLSVMIGRAGTGKTTTLQAVVKLHEEAGCAVWGMAPSATAADNLGREAACESDTLARYAYRWDKYHQAVEALNNASSLEERQIRQETVDKYAASLPDANTLWSCNGLVDSWKREFLASIKVILKLAWRHVPQGRMPPGLVIKTVDIMKNV